MIPITGMLRHSLLLLLLINFVSCAMNDMTIRVQSPAPVTISPAVKRVGIINRSLPAPDERNNSTLHTVLSGETFALLEAGSEESIRGLTDALAENNRFESVQVISGVNLYNPAPGSFQSPLSWDEVERICNRNELDALFVLETFDTELKILPSTIPMQLANVNQVINAIQQISISTIVKSGYRIYDRKVRIVADEYATQQQLTFQSDGNPLVTVDGLMRRKEYVKQTANRDGRLYAERILTYWHRVSREYFVRGSDRMKVAKRRARTGNWDGAAELWRKDVENPKRKTAGRACYNMAISNEINGNLDEAIRWAQRSYEDYKIRPALEYVNVLKRRKAQERLAAYQEGK